MNEAVFKSILHRVRGTEESSQMDEVRISEPENEIKHLPRTATAETLAASALAENTPGEVDDILRVWSDLFGMRLNSKRVRKQLEMIREWQSRWTSIRDQTTKGL